MKNLLSQSIRTKLIISFLVIASLPVSILGFLAYRNFRQELEKEAFAKLIAVREVKKSATERYFHLIHDQILTFSEDQMIIDSMADFNMQFRNFIEENALDTEKLSRMSRQLKNYYTGEFSKEYMKQNNRANPNAEQYYNQLDEDSIALQYYYICNNAHPLGSKHLLDRPDDGSDYSRTHAKIHPIVRDYLEKFGYYDIFLVDSETGDIVYSVFKELDFSTSLINGPYSQTNFGEAFRLANATGNKDEVVLVDYARYAPSYEAPASFIASPIFDGDKKIGVAMFQMPIDRLNEILSERDGLGNTGETYLIGSDHLMRSDSYLDPENHSVIASFRNPEKGMVVTDAAKAALAGESKAECIVDYNGNRVLSAYAPVELNDMRWAILAEIDVSEAFAAVMTLRNFIVLLTIGISICVIVYAFFVSDSIAKPIKNLSEVTSKVSVGDLTISVPVESRDEIGILAGGFSSMVNGLNQIVLKLKQAVAQITSAGNEILASSEQQAAGAREQSSAVSETSSAAMELSKTSEQVGKNIKTVSEMAYHVLEGMQKIKEASNQTNHILNSLNDKSKQISNITQLIDDIADQTNLLAVNASIEAARAGDQGRGFTVVADQISKLADSTAKSTKDISDLIEMNQHEMSKAILAMEESLAGVEEETQLAEQSAEKAKEIAMIANQQISGAKQIAEAMSSIDQTMRTITAGVQLSTETVKQLTSLADELNVSISGFKVVEKNRTAEVNINA